eukprot:15477262-Alexandrium_andersonii.AAC.1
MLHVRQREGKSNYVAAKTCVCCCDLESTLKDLLSKTRPSCHSCSGRCSMTRKPNTDRTE